MNIIDITEMIENNGLFTTILIILTFLFISMIRSDWFGKFLGKISDIFIEKFMTRKIKDIGEQVKSISESDLINHDIFNYIDFWTYSKVPTFQFSTEYRTVVFRKYLTIYLRTHKRKIKNFINAKEYEIMDNSHLIKSLLDLMNQIVYDYEREMRDIGIPEIIIEKMKIRNNDSISLIIKLIEETCISRFYDSDKNYLKIYSILNIISSVLGNTINNSDSVCNSINGALKGQEFDGKKEP